MGSRRTVIRRGQLTPGQQLQGENGIHVHYSPCRKHDTSRGSTWRFMGPSNCLKLGVHSTVSNIVTTSHEALSNRLFLHPPCQCDMGVLDSEVQPLQTHLSQNLQSISIEALPLSALIALRDFDDSLPLLTWSFSLPVHAPQTYRVTMHTVTPRRTQKPESWKMTVTLEP